MTFVIYSAILAALLPAPPPRRTTQLPLQPSFTPSSKYWCGVCTTGTEKKKQFSEHLAGKRHAEMVSAAERSWSAWQTSRWHDEQVPREAVTAAFSMNEFLSGLPVRTRSQGGPRQRIGHAGTEGMIAPHLTVSALPAVKRAQLWRYLRDLMGDGHDSLPELVAAVDDRYLRVKEILESAEVYRLAHKAIWAAGYEQPSRAQSSQELLAIDTVYDVACGHGLVGLLLAYRFRALQVVSVDLVHRPAFDAWASALGLSEEPRVAFRERPFEEAIDERQAHERALVLCVHGCNEVNRLAVRCARRGGAGWLLVPCCLQVDAYLPASYSVRLSDEVRYALLCGAMASEYGAAVVWALDSRITGRGIVLGGGPPLEHDLEARVSTRPQFVCDSISIERK